MMTKASRPDDDESLFDIDSSSDDESNSNSGSQSADNNNNGGNNIEKISARLKEGFYDDFSSSSSSSDDEDEDDESDTDDNPSSSLMDLKPVLKEGDEIYAAWWDLGNNETMNREGAMWFPGTVHAVKEVTRCGGSRADKYGPIRLYNIHYDDGDELGGVLDAFVFPKNDYLLNKEVGEEYWKNVRKVVDESSSDKYASKVGWYLVSNTAVSGKEKSFATLYDAMMYADEQIIKRLGGDVRNSDLNLPEEWMNKKRRLSRPSMTSLDRSDSIDQPKKKKKINAKEMSDDSGSDSDDEEFEFEDDSNDSLQDVVKNGGRSNVGSESGSGGELAKYSGIIYIKGTNRYRGLIRISHVNVQLGNWVVAADAANAYDEYCRMKNMTDMDLNFNSAEAYEDARAKEILRRRLNVEEAGTLAKVTERLEVFREKWGAKGRRGSRSKSKNTVKDDSSESSSELRMIASMKTSSDYNGVEFSRRKEKHWTASDCYNGRDRTVGVYTLESDAAFVHDKVSSILNLSSHAPNFTNEVEYEHVRKQEAVSLGLSLKVIESTQAALDKAQIYVNNILSENAGTDTLNAPQSQRNSQSEREEKIDRLKNDYMSKWGRRLNCGLSFHDSYQHNLAQMLGAKMEEDGLVGLQSMVEEEEEEEERSQSNADQDSDSDESLFSDAGDYQENLVASQDSVAVTVHASNITPVKPRTPEMNLCAVSPEQEKCLDFPIGCPVMWKMHVQDEVFQRGVVSSAFLAMSPPYGVVYEVNQLNGDSKQKKLPFELVFDTYCPVYVKSSPKDNTDLLDEGEILLNRTDGTETMYTIQLNKEANEFQLIRDVPSSLVKYRKIEKENVGYSRRVTTEPSNDEGSSSHVDHMTQSQTNLSQTQTNPTNEDEPRRMNSDWNWWNQYDEHCSMSMSTSNSTISTKESALARFTGGNTNKWNGQSIGINLPSWFFHDNGEKYRLNRYLTDRPRGGRSIFDVISVRTNCTLRMSNEAEIRIETKPGRYASEDIRGAKCELENALVSYLNRDACIGRLFHDLALSCNQLHPQRGSSCVYQRNPWNLNEMGYMSVVELPSIANQEFHGSHLLSRKHRTLTQVPATMILVHPDGRFPTRLCKPYVWLFSRTSRDVDEAVKIVTSANRLHATSCGCIMPN